MILNKHILTKQALSLYIIMKPKLPIYKMTINPLDEESGVDYVALVDEPAIQVDWFAFKEDKPFKFKADADRRIITGALMIADLPIYRNDPKMGEFMVVFDAPTIEQIVQKFFKRNKSNNVNEMHDTPIEGVFMYESFITDKDRGILAPKGFKDVPDGSWFGSYKVENDDVWEDFIKTGEFKGFSVEGMFDLQPVKMRAVNHLEEFNA